MNIKVIGVFKIVNGRGRSSTISISNTKNRTINKKKRREKGIREEEVGSNPHSKGDSFSRLGLERMVRINESIKMTRGRNIRMIENNINTKAWLIIYNINVIRFSGIVL